MTAGRPGLRTVLANRAYRRQFAAQTVSRWGDTASTVALVVLVFQLTGSGLKVTGVVIAEIQPVLLLAPVAGVVADRLPRVGVMAAADLWRMGLAALLPLASTHLAAVYALAFGMSAGTVFFSPASAAALPAIVSEDELIAANSGLWTAAVVSQVAVAPVTGAIVAAWGVAPAFYFNAATFAFSALTLARLRLPRPPPPAPADSRAGRLLEGVRLLARDRLLRLLAFVQLLAALSAGATSALLVVLAERHLHAGPGAALGPLVLARLTSNPRRPALVFGPYLLRGAVDLILALTRSLPAAMGALVLYGAGTSTGMVTYNSLLQAEGPAGTRGRVFAGFDMIWQTGRLASLALGGIAADILGIRAVYAIGGALLVLAGTIGLAGLAPTAIHPDGSSRQGPGERR